MRVFWFIFLAGALLATGGCKSPAGKSAGAPDTAAQTSKSKPKAKSGKQAAPELTLRGRVMMVNANSRSVIVSFPLGWLPALERRMNVYRQGEKVGEVKITGPRMDTNIAADLLTGQAAVGDEVNED